MALSSSAQMGTELILEVKQPMAAEVSPFLLISFLLL